MALDAVEVPETARSSFCASGRASLRHAMLLTTALYLGAALLLRIIYTLLIIFVEWRKPLKSNKPLAEEPPFDVIVVGGGSAGACNNI